MKYAGLFFTLAVLMAWLAVRGGPATWVLFYPAFSFAIVSIAYFRNDARLFGKRCDGGRTWWGYLLLGPYLAYVSIVWRLVTAVSTEAAYNRLGDDIYLSRRLLSHELPDDVASVVDLTCEFCEPTRTWSIDHYRCVPMLDGSAASVAIMMDLANEIAGMPKPVLIHCAQGHGRTGLVAAAVELHSGRAETVAEAIANVRAVRPGIGLHPPQQRVLEQIV